ncbi:CBS domain-containing protein [Acidihalobacter ferrooxydans]|uniref:CBS domain-containing protein n=1 Tax=Acidihalobacter ferrooxydans TaxID=1765967 RepID=A0A1P8UK37_9GAMM|nr:CBS domain-containing protein [Acidihalobacter ferrooxydans]APZ44198.1 hypothetical protein BW247_14800 [Acidihalobacter ferrooxydans]
MSVAQFCNRDAVTIAADACALEAAKLMHEHTTSVLVVIEETEGVRRPRGLLSAQALATRVIAAQADPGEVRAADIMRAVDTCVTEDEPVWKVVEHMRSNHQRTLPVVDADGGLIGVLAADDIFALLSAGLVDIAALLHEQPPAPTRATPAKRGARRKPARKAPRKPTRKKTSEGESTPATEPDSKQETPTVVE